jgi:hypothetical protein
MDDRFTRISTELDYEKERFEKKRNEDSLFFNSFISDTAKKYDHLVHDSKARLASL